MLRPELPRRFPSGTAIKVGGFNASTTETTMKNTISTRITRSCTLSLISFTRFPLIKSSVRVELEVSTSEDRVDIDADSTSIITIPINRSGRVDSIDGITAS